MIWDRKYVHFFGMALEALPEEKRRLGVICALAAAGHLLVFFLVSIEYPQAVPIHVARTNITLFTVDSGADGLTREKEVWYEMNDPSRFIRIQSNWLGNDPLNIAMLESSEVSRSQVILSEDRTSTFLPNQLDVLSNRAVDSLKPPLQQFKYELTDKPEITPNTVAQWEEPLRSRWTGPEWQLPSVTCDLLDKPCVTVLRLAVNAEGQVEHVLVESGSVRSEIDLLGVEAARHLRFLVQPQVPLQWGRVSIFWKLVAPQPEAVQTQTKGGA